MYITEDDVRGLKKPLQPCIGKNQQTHKELFEIQRQVDELLVTISFCFVEV
jgi:hypothetical protein